VARRSFVFARAGFGKSNLNKLLFSKLYETTPTVEKREGRRVPVGTVIFDPDGEYFWPDDKGRPGLCDVPELRDQLVVFTPRNGPSPFYQSFVAGGIKLDVRRLRPADVVAIALGPERQDQQNVRKLRALDQGRWETLVNLVDQHGHMTALDDVAKLLDLDADRQQMEALAARANITNIVRMIHDRRSQLMDMLLQALSKGKLCVIDVSQMRGGQALVLSGIILRYIFDHNQREFTAAQPVTIPTIAVVEEAQAVLDGKSSATEPYVTWVKEGRKYDLGAVLITQQPGSIPLEILSQGDNWFIFHLLSSGDLFSLKQANAHFSDDLLSSLLNEPIPGQGVFWSSASGRPYPTPVRVLSFEHLYRVLDPDYRSAGADTFAGRLKADFQAQVQEAVRIVPLIAQSPLMASGGNGHEGQDALRTVEDAPEPDMAGEAADPLDIFKRRAIQALAADREIRDKLQGDGVAWGGLKAYLADHLPPSLHDRDQIAYQLVRPALDEILGPRGKEWHSYKNDRGTTYAKVGPG
jgi:hypothetical protein